MTFQHPTGRVARAPLCTVLLATFFGVRAHAQAPGSVPPTVAMLDSALAVELRALAGTRLDLETATALALANATAVQSAAAELQAAEGVVRRERGGFDPALFAAGTRSSFDSPTASPFAGAAVLETDELVTSFGADVRLTTGTRLAATLSTTRRTTNSSFATLDPQYDALGSITLVQPLLAGFGAAARAELTAAERERDATRAFYEGVVLAVGAEVEQVYWALYAAERDVAVAKVLRDAAAALHESADRRARAGLVGPNQVANAAVFLADQEAGLLDGGERRGALSDRLASLLGRRPDPGEEFFRTLGEPPRTFEPTHADTAVAHARRSNRTLAFLHSRRAAVAARERGAARDALPTLDFVGSLGASGLAGAGQDVIFGADTLRTDLDTSWQDSWSDVFAGDFPNWSAGLAFRMPIGRREGRGERDRLRAEVRRAEQDELAADHALEEAVRARHRELENAAARLEFAKNGVDASFEQARIGRLEFENGRTTAFELVRLAGDLAEAQVRFSDALVRAATAVAQLRELTGGTYPAEVSR